MALKKTISKSAVRQTKKTTSLTSKTETKNNALPNDVSFQKTPYAIFKGKALQKKYIIIAAVLLIIVLVFLAKNLLIAAVVNGQPISRFSVINQLEKSGGKKVLDSLITEKLIEDEAQKRNIIITDVTVTNQINTIQKNIESQGSTLDSALAQQGMSRTDLTKQVKLQLILNKMIGSPAVSNKEIDDYMNANKAQLPQGENDTMLRAQVRQQLVSQKLQQKSQEFVANLRKQAHVVYFVNY